ncbi:hypothetical protein NC651_018765 [Populus alba x Populus x berolinensis]|nr:hypothetical protein NC651_018765 [Populus alba x Populus x berolinensis]
MKAPPHDEKPSDKTTTRRRHLASSLTVGFPLAILLLDDACLLYSAANPRSNSEKKDKQYTVFKEEVVAPVDIRSLQGTLGMANGAAMGRIVFRRRKPAETTEKKALATKVMKKPEAQNLTTQMSFSGFSPTPFMF